MKPLTPLELCQSLKQGCPARLPQHFQGTGLLAPASTLSFSPKHFKAQECQADPLTALSGAQKPCLDHKGILHELEAAGYEMLKA